MEGSSHSAAPRPGVGKRGAFETGLSGEEYDKQEAREVTYNPGLGDSKKLTKEKNVDAHKKHSRKEESNYSKSGDLSSKHGVHSKEHPHLSRDINGEKRHNTVEYNESINMDNYSEHDKKKLLHESKNVNKKDYINEPKDVNMQRKHSTHSKLEDHHESLNKHNKKAENGLQSFGDDDQVRQGLHKSKKGDDSFDKKFSAKQSTLDHFNSIFDRKGSERVNKLEVTDGDTDDDDDDYSGMLDFHSDYRRQIKDKNNKLIQDSHKAKQSSHEKLDGDYGIQTKAKNISTMKNKHFENKHDNKISGAQSAEKNQFGRIRSPLDRASSPGGDYEMKIDGKGSKNVENSPRQTLSKNQSVEKKSVPRDRSRSPRDGVSSPDDVSRKSHVAKERGSKQGQAEQLDDLFVSASRRPRSSSGRSVESNEDAHRSRSSKNKEQAGVKLLEKKEKSFDSSSKSKDKRSNENSESSGAKLLKNKQKSFEKFSTKSKDSSTNKDKNDKHVQEVARRPLSAKERKPYMRENSGPDLDSGTNSLFDSEPHSRLSSKNQKDTYAHGNEVSSDESDFEISTSFSKSKSKKSEKPSELDAQEKRKESMGSIPKNNGRRGDLNDKITQGDPVSGRPRVRSDIDSNPWGDRKLSERRDMEQQEFSRKKSGSLGSLLHQQESSTKKDDFSPRNNDLSRTGKKDINREAARSEKPKIKGNLAPKALNNSKSKRGNGYWQTTEASDSDDDFGHEDIQGKKHMTEMGTSGRKMAKKQKDKDKKVLSSRTGPLKANINIQDASVKKTSSQSQEKTRNGDSRKLANKRSLSFTNISNIMRKSPFYCDETQDDNSRPKATDSASLREQIYFDWLKKKDTRTKSQILKQRQEEKEKEEEAEREKQEKLIMSKKAFEAWTTNKVEKTTEKQEILKEKKLSEKEKADEFKQKKLDSKKYFESWKAKKDEDLMEQHRKKVKEEREKRQKELEETDEKLNSSKKVYENWKSKKDDVIREKIKQKKLQEKQEKLIEYEKREKKKKAEKAFENWKEKKPPSPREPGPSLTQRAWCPSSRNSGHIVPQQVQPVIQRNPPNRSRTLSATRTLSTSRGMAR